jgi:hypothetical protein
MAEAKLDFSCGGKIAGRFIDLATYPKTAGRYRYMPYRGPGHLLLQEECRRSGFARCTYPEPNGQVSFRVRTAAEYGVLDVDEIYESG